MPVERYRYNRSRSLSGPYSYVILLAENLIEDGPIFNHSRAMDWADAASDTEKLWILEKMGYNLNELRG